MKVQAKYEAQRATHFENKAKEQMERANKMILKPNEQRQKADLIAEELLNAKEIHALAKDEISKLTKSQTALEREGGIHKLKWNPYVQESHS